MQWKQVFFLIYNSMGAIALGVLILVGFLAWTHARADHQTVRLRADEPDVDETVVFWLFYADWCGACQTAKPCWKEFRDTYENRVHRGYRIECRETDCTDVERVRTELTQHSITRFPTVLLQRRGEERRLRGPVNSTNLIELLNSDIDR